MHGFGKYLGVKTWPWAKEITFIFENDNGGLSIGYDSLGSKTLDPPGAPENDRGTCECPCHWLV